MSNLDSSKDLAGIGSILLLFPVVSIIGIILLYVGVKGLSEYYKDESIYKNALRGLLYGIIALIAIAASVPLLILGGVFSVFTLGPFGLGLGVIYLPSDSCHRFHFLCSSSLALQKSFQ